VVFSVITLTNKKGRERDAFYIHLTLCGGNSLLLNDLPDAFQNRAFGKDFAYDSGEDDFEDLRKEIEIPCFPSAHKLSYACSGL